jgi:predicted nucleotide-binding protein
MEVVDAGEVRLKKIELIISQAQFGIHDLSNMDLDKTSGLPRFNMPFELGLFMGAQRYGDAKQKRKRSAIFDKEKYRYQKSISDIAGQDIQSHGGDVDEVIKCTRNWLDSHRPKSAKKLPGARYIVNRYRDYCEILPAICHNMKLDYDDLTFSDKWETITDWMITEQVR